jgi:hypothetical protein
MSKARPAPYVPVELLGGRLVRVCPDCKEQIGERTDDDGVVSNNFAEHYGAQHTEQEPERQRGYVLALQPRDDGEPRPGPDALRNVSNMIVDIVKKQVPDLDWQLVHRLEDLPEGSPALMAAQVIRGSWQMDGDDSQVRQVRWYRRDEEHLVFTPTTAQLDEWDAARDRARDVRAALIERHRDALPSFTGDTVAEWEAYYGERKLREDEIAKEFDAQRDAAMDQFYRGDHSWLATLEGAIRDLEIPDREVEELRARTEARLAEAEAALRIT